MFTETIREPQPGSCPKTCQLSPAKERRIQDAFKFQKYATGALRGQGLNLERN